jgi:SagB-type dehydrogenase family enzyme
MLLNEVSLSLEKDLLRAINERRSKRKMANELTNQQLSDLIYCTAGETMKATSKAKSRRVIASACNSQKVTLYVCLESGVYRYNQVNHDLEMINEQDIRKQTCKQTMLKRNFLAFCFVADMELKTGVFKIDEKTHSLFVGTEIGAMTQNAALYCASQDLNNVVVGMFDRIQLNNLLKLDENSNVMMVQVVG